MKPEGPPAAVKAEEATSSVDTKPVASKSADPPVAVKEEQRDESSKGNEKTAGTTSASASANTSTRDPPPKKSSKSKKSSSSRNSSRYPPDRYPYPNRGPYAGPGMHGGPRGPPPPPPPYGYPHSDPHFRGPPPPPHYHQMPPHMHHSGGPYPGPGHGGPYGPPPGMGGRHPGSGYGVPPYGHYMGGPPMPPYHGLPGYPGSGNPPMPGVNENNSISSNKSKSSTKSKSNSSKNASRKKRTIEGVHESMPPPPHPHPNPHHPEMPPSAYAFRRTASSASSSTTVTAGNNTSTETHNTEDSKRESRDRVHELPPLSHPSHTSSFEEGSSRRFTHHRRDHSGTSTTSSLSVGNFSLSSHEGPHRGLEPPMSHEDAPMMKQSPKRRKGEDAKVLMVDTGAGSHHQQIPSPGASLDAAESTRFEQLSMEDRDSRQIETSHSGEQGASLFLTLSTSPINHADVDATPISKNTKKPVKSVLKTTAAHHQGSAFRPPSNRKPADPPANKMIDRAADTPTPPMPTSGMVESEMMIEEHSMLNRHLRGQSFTPLGHMGPMGESAPESPSNMGAFGSIAPQLSWSIAGDTPSLGDLAEWEEHAQQGAQLKGDDKKRPGSTTSCNTRDMAISPHSFNMWADDDHNRKNGENDSLRLSILTPHSDLGMAEGTLSGTTTPLPIFFDQPSSEERENRSDHLSRSSRKKGQSKSGDTEHIHNLFVSNGGRSSEKSKGHMHHFWSKDTPTPVGSDNAGPMDLPPTPLFASSEYGRDESYARSPLDSGERHRDSFFPSSAMYGHPGSSGHERVRSLRGRVPPGHHLAPMPLHIPPPMSSHLPLTSPMGVGPGKAGMWSPHHSAMPPMSSPLHMSPMNMSQSKRKCVPLKPPIPSKFQGDIEKVKTAQVPEFTSLVNFPAHMSQKQAVNLPEGMRCCVMCGQACPCSSGNKNKKGCAKPGGKAGDGSLVPRNSNGQDMIGSGAEKGSYAIIPTQNKGLCTLCDVNVWVVVNTGLEIKWCKGCKNFRPWAAFGDKGLATKCLRCRERQREKYALQKEEKEKARLIAKAGSKK